MAYYNPPYTQEEQKKIVDYIIEKGLISRVKGDAIWKSMETDKVTNRSWHSMKQHYRKTIAWQLNRSHYQLDEDTLRKFYLANNAITRRKNTCRKRAPVDPNRRYPNFKNLSFSSSTESEGEAGAVVIRDISNNGDEESPRNASAVSSQPESEVRPVVRETEMDSFDSRSSRISDSSGDAESPRNANAILRVTPSKHKSGRLILDSSSETESDLGEEGATGGTQDVAAVCIDIADDTNDSVIEITNEYVVIN